MAAPRPNYRARFPMGAPDGHRTTTFNPNQSGQDTLSNPTSGARHEFPTCPDINSLTHIKKEWQRNVTTTLTGLGLLDVSE